MTPNPQPRPFTFYNAISGTKSLGDNEFFAAKNSLH